MQEKINPESSQEIKIFETKTPQTSWVKENVESYYWVKTESEVLSQVVDYMHNLQSQNQFVSTKKSGQPTNLKTEKEESVEFSATKQFMNMQTAQLINLFQLLQQSNPEATPTIQKALNFLQQEMGPSILRASDKQILSLNECQQLLAQLTAKAPLATQRIIWNKQLSMLGSMSKQCETTIKQLQNESQQIWTHIKPAQNLIPPIQSIQQFFGTTQPTEKQFLELVQNLQTLANQSAFLNKPQQQAVSIFFQTLASHTTPAPESSKAHESHKQIESTFQFIIEVETLVQNNYHSGKISTKQFIRLSKTVDSIQQQYKNNQSQESKSKTQTALNQVKNEITTLTGTAGIAPTAPTTSFVQITATVVVSNKISSFLKKNPDASDEEIIGALQSFLKESNLQNSSNPFMKQLGSSIQELINKPDAIGVGQAPTQYTSDETTTQPPSKAAANLISSLQQQNKENSVQLQSLEGSIKNLTSLRDQFHKAALFAVAQSMQTGVAPKSTSSDDTENIPNEFANVILNTWMPNMEAKMMEMAMILDLDNGAAQFGNVMLQDILGFSGAANDFDFSNWLNKVGGSGNEFSGSYKQALAQLKAEIEQCKKKIAQVIQAEKDINAHIAKLKKEEKTASGSAKANITGQIQALQQTLGNLQALYNPLPGGPQGSLIKLHNLLNTIKITPGPTDFGGGQHFNVSSSDPDWQANLQTDESNVVNGQLINGKTVGGLVNVYNEVNTFQQTYSDMGQNQMMMLQMTLTEIQQGWTAVTTAMQQLNQMYTTVAHAIYRG